MTITAIAFALLAAYCAYKWRNTLKDKNYLNDLVDKKSFTIIELENQLQDCTDKLRVYEDKSGQGNPEI